MLILVASDRSGAHMAHNVGHGQPFPIRKGPPVVIVSLDTTRADHMSLVRLPSKTTPNLEKFAAGATLFTQAMSASDMTLASHASIFTGVYASWHGAHPYTVEPAVVKGLDDRLPTLASILAAKGYLTIGVAANSVFLVPHWGLSRGFAVSAPAGSPETIADRHFNLRHGIRPFLALAMPSLRFRRSVPPRQRHQ